MAAYEYWHVYIDFGTGPVDVTADVDSMRGAVQSALGDGTEASDQPGVLRFVLNNLASKYTPDNPLSTLALSTGMPVVLSETIGANVYELHHGTIEFPEIGDWADPARDQQIAVFSVDQLSRWERSQTFVSTLGAHIMYNDDALQCYYPLFDEPYIEASQLTGPMETALTGSVVLDANRPLLEPGGPAVPYADDGGSTKFTAGVADTAVATAFKLVATTTFADHPLTLSPGQVLTVIVWVSPDMGLPDVQRALAITGSEASPTTAVLATLTHDPKVAVGLGGGGLWTFTFAGGLTASFAGAGGGTNHGYPIAMRYGYTPNVIELWAAGTRTVGSFGGSAPAGDTTIYTIEVGGSGYTGYVAHLQCHVGAEADFTYEDFIAQRDMGLEGLERQTTGERVATLARYGGLTDADLSAVDPGTSVMSRAGLAGKTIASAMYEARDTELGRLFIAGSGALSFHDRRTIDNV